MTTENTLPAVKLLIVDSWGVYIPQRFVDHFDMTKWEGISIEDVCTLHDGPDNPLYWETWDDVLKNATFSENGHKWLLSQEGDLWAYCLELMTEEEKVNMGFHTDGEGSDE